MNTWTSTEDDVAWLALLASGVEGSADVSHGRFSDELRRLHAPQAEPDHPAAMQTTFSQPAEGAMS